MSYVVLSSTVSLGCREADTHHRRLGVVMSQPRGRIPQRLPADTGSAQFELSATSSGDQIRHS